MNPLNSLTICFNASWFRSLSLFACLFRKCLLFSQLEPLQGNIFFSRGVLGPFLLAVGCTNPQSWIYPFSKLQHCGCSRALCWRFGSYLSVSELRLMMPSKEIQAASLSIVQPSLVIAGCCDELPNAEKGNEPGSIITWQCFC